MARKSKLPSGRRIVDDVREVERLRGMVEHLPIGAVFVASGAIQMNRATEKITGYSRDELRTLDDWFSHLHGERAEAIRQDYELQRQAGFASHLLRSITHKDGTERIVEFTRYRFDEHEVWLLHDATDRHRAEQALRESEERLRAVVETAPDAIITSDKRGIVKGVNRAAERMFGYSAEEFIGQNVSMLMPSPYREQHEGFMRRYVETGVARIIGIGREVTARRKDGSIFPIHLALSEADQFGCFTGIIRDITQRKAAEESLRREHELSENITNTAQNILLLLDTEGCIVRFNPYMEELTGWRLDEVRGRDWCDTFLPERDRPRIHELFSRAIRGERTRGNVNSIVTKDGRERNIEWYDAPLTSSEGEVVGLLWTGHDITERKRMERHLLEIAEEEQRRIGQDLHDDVGQQLTALSYLAHSLIEQTAAKTSPNLELTTKIADGIRQTQERVRAVVEGLVPVELHRGGLMLALQQLAERTSDTQKIVCKFRCQKSVSIKDNMVATHLYHIAQEAITNAVRHGQASQIAVTLTATDSEVCLEIRDNGIGIAEPNESASGHGLRIMAYRASIIGGTLSVRRGEPRGAVVTCTWSTAP